MIKRMTNELRLLVEARKVDGYGNMSRKEQQNIQTCLHLHLHRHLNLPKNLKNINLKT